LQYLIILAMNVKKKLISYKHDIIFNSLSSFNYFVNHNQGRNKSLVIVFSRWNSLNKTRASVTQTQVQEVAVWPQVVK